MMAVENREAMSEFKDNGVVVSSLSSGYEALDHYEHSSDGKKKGVSLAQLRIEACYEETHGLPKEDCPVYGLQARLINNPRYQERIRNMFLPESPIRLLLEANWKALECVQKNFKYMCINVSL
jgi:hypothetical protein